MKTNLYIPKRLCVGFNERKDTFTGKLAYIIYWDDKNVLRKADSFNSWRKKDIPVFEMNNMPTKGFILNKDIRRDNYHFGSGRSVIRVYHPEGFEFEISCSNLIGIIANTNNSKGEILEECVFAWSGKDLILLPVDSVEYQESLKFTEKQANKLSLKDLKKGCIYASKKDDDQLVYIDYIMFNKSMLAFKAYLYMESFNQLEKNKKQHVFYNLNKKCFVVLAANHLSHCTSEIVVDNYHKLLHYCTKSFYAHSDDIVEISLTDLDSEQIVSELENSTGDIVMLLGNEERKYPYLINMEFIQNKSRNDLMTSLRNKYTDVWYSYSYYMINQRFMSLNTNKQETTANYDQYFKNINNDNQIMTPVECIDFMKTVGAHFLNFKTNQGEQIFLI